MNKTIDTWLRSIKPDAAAYTFYSLYRLPDGRPLTPENIQQYCDEAAVLNALHKHITSLQRKRSSIGMTTTGIWPLAVVLVFEARLHWKHKLPENELRLRDKYKRYHEEGYLALVNKKFGNANSRKVTAEL